AESGASAFRTAFTARADQFEPVAGCYARLMRVFGISLRAPGSSGQWRPDGSPGQTSAQNSWLGKVSRPVAERYVTGRLLLSPCRLANLAVAYKSNEALAEVK